MTYKTGNGDNFTKKLWQSGSLGKSLLQYLEMQNIGLTYNMRITTFGISYLNPYVDRSNPTGISLRKYQFECGESSQHRTGLQPVQQQVYDEREPAPESLQQCHRGL